MAPPPAPRSSAHKPETVLVLAETFGLAALCWQDHCAEDACHVQHAMYQVFSKVQIRMLHQHAANQELSKLENSKLQEPDTVWQALLQIQVCLNACRQL